MQFTWVALYKIINRNGKTMNRELCPSLKYLTAGACDPVPSFIVNLSDMTPRLTDELNALDHSTRKFVLKQAVGRIIEDIDFQLYHNSISKVLEVKLK